jgi:hypothetical protein
MVIPLVLIRTVFTVDQKMHVTKIVPEKHQLTQEGASLMMNHINS